MSIRGDALLVVLDILDTINYDESKKPVHCDITSSEYCEAQLLFLAGLLAGEDVENLSLLELKADLLKKDRDKIKRRINFIIREEGEDNS